MNQCIESEVQVERGRDKLRARGAQSSHCDRCTRGSAFCIGWSSCFLCMRCRRGWGVGTEGVMEQQRDGGDKVHEPHLESKTYIRVHG